MTAPRRAAAIAAALLALTVAAGCGDDTGTRAPVASSTGTSADQRPADPAAGAMIAGPTGPNIGEVLADTTGDPVVAAGHLLVAPGGSARLCAVMAQSAPPRCGTPSIPVTGLPPELVAGLTEMDGTRWSDGLVQLIGRVEDGTFVNDPELLAAS